MSMNSSLYNGLNECNKNIVLPVELIWVQNCWNITYRIPLVEQVMWYYKFQKWAKASKNFLLSKTNIEICDMVPWSITQGTNTVRGKIIRHTGFNFCNNLRYNVCIQPTVRILIFVVYLLFKWKQNGVLFLLYV